MAYDLAQAITDFETLQLDEFGETITYLAGGTSSRSLQAVRPHTNRGQIDVRSGARDAGAVKVEILVSRGSTNGVATVQKGIDKVRMRQEPDDTNETTFRVQYAQHEYGAWRLGLY
jgi:hypothetical protein